MKGRGKDERFMRMALRLAAKAKGRTRPNPMVGAVVVRSGRVVGRGFHRRAGRPHAEVLALRQAGRSAKGATLYVSLEPCPHTGRTPPCTEAIAAAGIRRVVVAMIDPNPRSRGRGLRWLRRRGIRTAVGILEEEARRLNEVFVTWMTARRPFVTVKVAQSLDGKIATRAGESRWISGPAARRWVQDLRSRVDAVLVGVETVLKDDPQLTVRLEGGRQPVRIILDSKLRTPPRARLFSSKGPVLIAAGARGSAATRSSAAAGARGSAATRSSAAAGAGAPGDREKKLEKAGAEVLRLPVQGRDRRVSLPALLRELARRGISHLLIEGGGEVIASAFRARAVDRIACVVAAKIIGGRQAPTSVEGEGVASLGRAIPLKDLTARFLGEDLLVTGDVHWDR